MIRERLEFLKGAAAHFQKNPQAEEYLGVSRQTCFSVLALHFSSPTEILDPTHPDFLTNLNERVSLFEKNLEQKQPLPQTLVLPDDLEETTQKWQGQSGKTPTISPQLKETFENQLSNRSLKFWQKIKPDVAKKVGGVAGKVKFLGRFIRLAGKAFGPIGIAVTTLLSPSLIKKVLKLIAAALLGFYGLLTLLGTGALTGAAIGALIGGLVGGPAGATIGATIGAATGYAIEHWFWRPALNAWEGTGGALGGTGNFFGGLLSGAGNALGSFFSGTLSAVGGAATATGTFFTGLGAQLSTLSFATIPTVAIPLFGTIGIAAFGTLLTGTLITGSAFMSPPSLPGAPGTRPPPGGGCALAGDAPGSAALKEILNGASQWAGVPPGVLGAILEIEGQHVYVHGDPLIRQYSAPNGEDPDNCTPNECTARGPMQFTTYSGQTATCGYVYDTWSTYKNSVNLAFPAENRNPNVCNVKDSLYAGAKKIKADSATGPGETCTWTKEITDRVSTGYFGSTACSEVFARLGNLTYCEFVWRFYQKYNQIVLPPASTCPINNGAGLCGSWESSNPSCRHCFPGMYGYDCGPACNTNQPSCERSRAVDVSGPGGGANYDVSLPTIFGESLSWTFVRESYVQDPGIIWGWDKRFTAQNSKGDTYSLRLLHMEQGNPTLTQGATYPSGTMVGRLWSGLSGPHVHVTINENGIPQPADVYFGICGWH